MKIGIIGSRGIPNHYGGFEQFAARLSAGLTEQGHQLWVYNSHLHPYKENSWKNVNIIRCFDAEHLLGTAGQFIYDFNCIRDSRHRNFDVILQLGYTSSSVWGKLLPATSAIVTNMDGLEWKRSKYSNAVKKFLKLAEKLAVEYSDVLVADNLGIQKHLNGHYKKEAVFIPYGADIFRNEDETFLKQLDLLPFSYHLLIARPEPENNLEMILQGATNAGLKKIFLVVGNVNSAYGKFLQNKFGDERIRFVGAIYDEVLLNNLRHFSSLYFHGHSVGGTNPSLLEAMAAGARIVSHDNIFNRHVLGKDAFYFSNAEEVSRLIEEHENESTNISVAKNLEKIQAFYSWEHIISSYENLFEACVNRKKRKSP